MGNESSAEETAQSQTGDNPTSEEIIISTLDKIPQDSTYGAVHIFGGNQIYVIAGDDDFRSIIEKQFESQIGIAKRKTIGLGFYSLKTVGSAFASGSSKTGLAIKVQLAAAEIMRELFTVGWRLIATAKVSKTESLASWFFHRKDRCGDKRCFSPDSCVVLGLSVNEKSRHCVRYVLNLPNLQDFIENLLRSENVEYQVNKPLEPMELKVEESAWFASIENRTEGLQLLVKAFCLIEKQGYKYYGRIDLRGKADIMFLMPASPISASVEDFVVVSLVNDDVLAVHRASDEVAQSIRTEALTRWPHGVHSEYVDTENIDRSWKLKGTPFNTSGIEALAAKKMMLALFVVLENHGYEHYATLDLSRKWADKGTLFFRKSRANRASQKRHFAAVSPGCSDRLRLVNFPINGCETLAIQRVIENTWPNGILEVNLIQGSTEVKMRGWPFCAESERVSDCLARMIMCAAVATLADQGWTLVTTCCMARKDLLVKDLDYHSEMDTWFFARDESESDRNAASANGKELVVKPFTA